MANLFKSLDTGGFISTLRDFGLAIRQFFGTKIEMDVVATALTDLDRRIDESIQSIAVGTVTTGSPGSSAQVTVSGSDTDVILNFSIPRGADGTNGRDGIDGVDGANGKDGTNGRDGIDGKDGKDGVTPTISVGTVTTLEAGKEATVSKRGTDTNVIFDFSIPRGEQGDLKELNDTSERIEAIKQWQSNSNVVFADIVEVPIPTEQAMYSLADCIKQTNLLTNLKIKINRLSATYQCNALHWHIQCSNIYSSRVVYSTKYATPDADFVSVDTPNNSAPPTTIEITVTSEKGGSRYVHVAIENVYGRAYYYVTKK